MASYLQVENLSKSYGTRTLFKNISFNINEGDKIALVAPNGTGKTSLLNILAGKYSSDGNGVIKFIKDIRISFIEQETLYDPDRNVFDIVREAADKSAYRIEDHKVNATLYKIGLTQTNKTIGQLSGGEVKRVSIACALVSDPDFLIMDEPTNHLDLESIEFLEDYLSHSRATIFMVTHDRYFLDRVCNKIFELWEGSLYQYEGNYSYFLEKREERIKNIRSETDRARNLLRTELDWMRRMPCARGTKAKYRIDAFHDLKERASRRIHEEKSSINVGSARLGRKIINCTHMSYIIDTGSYRFVGVDDFTYNFAPGEKVGIVGKNGVGKSTFLSLLTGELEPTGGKISRGETLVTGYYKQEGIKFKEDDTVIETVRAIAEVVTLADGKNVPVSTFLNQFLFPPSMHYTKVSQLSGGEKRRLYLLTVLMRNPNLLVLDEPTNDLDILTLNVLEEYLSNFKGSLIIVSHDRFFLDKLAQHLFIFEGNGIIKDFVGSYSGYRQYMKDREIERQRAENDSSGREKYLKEKEQQKEYQRSKKLTYKEQQLYKTLLQEIETLEKEKKEIEARLSAGNLTVEQITKDSTRIGEIAELLDEKVLLQLELEEKTS